MTEKTKVLSVHPFRRTARRKERELQRALDMGALHFDGELLPPWARGARVEHAGPFQFAVTLTSHKGH